MLNTSDRTFALFDPVPSVSQKPQPGISAAPRLSLSDLNRFGGATWVRSLKCLQNAKTHAEGRDSSSRCRLEPTLLYLRLGPGGKNIWLATVPIFSRQRTSYACRGAISARPPISEFFNLRVAVCALETGLHFARSRYEACHFRRSGRLLPSCDSVANGRGKV